MKSAELKAYLDRIEATLEKMQSKLANVEAGIHVANPTEDISDDDVVRLGERFDYFILRDEEDISDFRDLVYFIKSNPERFNQREIDYAGYTDKSFDDVRLSKFAIKIMHTAYKKIYRGDDWAMQFEPISLYKYRNRIVWKQEDVADEQP